MFIIIGNNIQECLVKILDTSDKKEDWVTYEFLQKGIQSGIQVSGVSKQGEILCKNTDLYKEIINKSKLLEAKILLLKLDIAAQHQVFLNLLKPYGLAQTEEDIQYSLDTHTLVLLFVSKCLDLQTCYCNDIRVGVLVDEKDCGTPMQRFLYKELNKMYYTNKDNTMYMIRYSPAYDVFYCIIGPCLYKVHVSKSGLFQLKRLNSLETLKQLYVENTVPNIYFELYLEKTWATKPNNFISKIELLAEAVEYNKEVRKKMLQLIKSDSEISTIAT